ncbi:hypothetical protein IW261DRAFT_1568669 [Armillaria novae-zelandiae]|uniref:PH domain-containing protein n=1 Tax=Armillaria novae-zelandiae TaxID=153914 RepID=A0AA39NZ23_9AGAR|nr:hypothetical protein IW261DRAFT_1568669 [Armillaria novae-zelandiae]
MVSELDFFTPAGKPVLVLSLIDTRVVEFINNERSYMFKVDTEDGGHYLLQAMNQWDMSKWLETINWVSKIAAKRRLTYIGRQDLQHRQETLMLSLALTHKSC